MTALINPFSNNILSVYVSIGERSRWELETVPASSTPAVLTYDTHVLASLNTSLYSSVHNRLEGTTLTTKQPLFHRCDYKFPKTDTANLSSAFSGHNMICSSCRKHKAALFDREWNALKKKQCITFFKQQHLTTALETDLTRVIVCKYTRWRNCSHSQWQSSLSPQEAITT